MRDFDSRTARMSRDTDGEALGVTIALSADELRRLGVAVDRVDSVEYAVGEDGLRIREPPMEVTQG